MPAETLALLAGLGDRVAWVRGNTERELIERRGADPDEGELWDRRATWAAGRLTPADLALFGSWPLTVTITIHGLGPVCFCHATPRSDCEIFTAISPPERVGPMLGPDVELRRTEYDVEAAAARIRATGIPDAGGFAADLLRPASAE
jgi:hypothetical protein